MKISIELESFDELLKLKTMLTGQRSPKAAPVTLTGYVADLELGTRAHNALIAAEIFTLEQLANTPDEQLRRISNVGEKTRKEIRDAHAALTLIRGTEAGETTGHEGAD